MPSEAIGITFWIVIAVIVVASLLYSYFKNLELQKTIRLAIEKGMPLDAESIEKLMRKKTGKPVDFYLSGIICFSCCIGLMALGPFIAKIEPKTFFPIIGSGIMVGVISIGLLLSGIVIDRQERKEKKGGRQQ